jgi:hypothetical protein
MKYNNNDNSCNNNINNNNNHNDINNNNDNNNDDNNDNDNIEAAFVTERMRTRMYTSDACHVRVTVNPANYNLPPPLIRSLALSGSFSLAPIK